MLDKPLLIIAFGSDFNLLPTVDWKLGKDKLLVMQSSKTKPFLSSNPGTQKLKKKI